MPVFRRRRGRPLIVAIIAIIGDLFFNNDGESDQYYTDDSFANPYVWKD